MNNKKNNKKTLIKNSVIAFFLTILIGYIVIIINVIINKENGGMGIAMSLAWATILLPLFAILNLFYLLLVYHTTLSKKLLSNWKFTLLEIILYYGIYHGIHKLISMIPYEYKFTITPELTSIKFYYTYPFDYIYTFIILTFIILIFRKPLEKRSKLNKNKE